MSSEERKNETIREKMLEKFDNLMKPVSDFLDKHALKILLVLGLIDLSVIIYDLFHDPYRVLRGLLGISSMLAIAYLFSQNRKAISLRTLIGGLVIQFSFALLVLRTPIGVQFFKFMNDVIVGLLSYSEKGIAFLFASFNTGQLEPALNNFAFKILPTILFFSSLISILYFLGVMQLIILTIARIVFYLMDTSGGETLVASSNIFVGQTEAPLLVKPYIGKMTRSEVFAVMVAGMATVAGGVMAAYVGMLYEYIPGIAGHLMSASVMAAPGALLIAKILVPETEESLTKGELKLHYIPEEANVIDAAAKGATDGMYLAFNVGAMLLVFISLIHLLNAGTSWVTGLLHSFLPFIPVMNLQELFGYLMAPIAWLIGIPAKEAVLAGSLIGEKVVINEFVAYMDLAHLLQNTQYLDVMRLLNLPDQLHVFSLALPGIGDLSFSVTPAHYTFLSFKTRIMLSYALCGFANFSSIAIQIGGISSLAPEKRPTLSQLGLYAVLGGTLTNLLVASIAGLLYTGGM